MQPVDAKKCGYAVLAVALCLMVFAGEYFVYYSDAFEYDADVRWEDGSINYEIGSSGSDVYDVVLLDGNGSAPVSNLAIFVDEKYSTHYDEASESASISHNDQDYFATQILLALDNRGFDGGFKCDSDGLYEFLITTLDDPRGCGVLVTSYSLPASVYAGSEDDLLIRWVSAGGTLYWTGSEIGGFCTDDDGLHRIADTQTLLFGGECVYSGEEVVATQVIDNGFTEALSLKTGNLSFGLRLNGIEGALGMGYEGDGISTVGFVPFGSGSICVFSGLYDLDLVDDIAQILSAGVTLQTDVVEHHTGNVTRTEIHGSFDHFDETCHVYAYIGGTYTKFGEAFDAGV